MRLLQICTLTLSLAGTGAVAKGVKGFNFGAQEQTYDNFVASFRAMQNLQKDQNNQPVFNTARLYTSTRDQQPGVPIDAFQAAMVTHTNLMVGLDLGVEGDVDTLMTAIKTNKNKLTDLIIGIGAGNEDLYRSSELAVLQLTPGASLGTVGPDQVVAFIQDVRSKLGALNAATPGLSAGLENKIGHVDTWQSLGNASNAAIWDAMDWAGMNAFPAWQKTDNNIIGNAHDLFKQAFDNNTAVAKQYGKELKLTETGWPTNSLDPDTQLKNMGKAEGGVDNAQTYWTQVACGIAFPSQDDTFWFEVSGVDDNGYNWGVQGSVAQTPGAAPTTYSLDLACSTATA